MRQAAAANTQTIRELAALDYYFLDHCLCRTPRRTIEIDLAALAAGAGDMTVSQAMRRIVCVHCGTHGALQVHHRGTRDVHL